MSKCFLPLIAIAVTGTWAAPSLAKPGDVNWAQCVWSKEPEAANKWLLMPTPSWQSKFTEANVLLGHKLIAMCDGGVADPLKPGHEPKWPSLASALKRAKPKSEQPSGAGSADAVFLCQTSSSKDGKMFTHLAEIVRRTGGSEAIAYQQYFAEAEGAQVKLPQNLRSLPKDDVPVGRVCQEIGTDGELADAQG
jgi:hypothetical protein